MLLVSTSTENNEEMSLSVDISVFIKVHNTNTGNWAHYILDTGYS